MTYINELLRLLQVPQIGAQRIGRLLTEVDFGEFCQYDKTALRQMGWNEKQIQRWFQPDWQWIERAEKWADPAKHQHILSLFDADYPFLLRQISTAPPILFVKGSVASLSLPQIAMVGSRDYSPYGEYWANVFSAQLAQNGVAVTSGLAVGIDGFCHQKALENQGVTIAVLGSGLNRIYPVRHKGLSEKIVAFGGALVSEFCPDQPPLAENFPRRNRIISGLSLGTLVVEATMNSGSLITARYALEQGREVFALPNTVQNPYSQGCHKLIKQGALLVDSVDDILEAIAFQQQVVQPPKSPRLPVQNGLFADSNSPKIKPTQAVSSPAKKAKNMADLTACQQRIFTHIGLEPISPDDLAKASEMPIEMLLVELLSLELVGVVKQVSGGYVQC